jgi:hypothetical protein
MKWFCRKVHQSSSSIVGRACEQEAARERESTNIHELTAELHALLPRQIQMSGAPTHGFAPDEAVFLQSLHGGAIADLRRPRQQFEKDVVRVHVAVTFTPRRIFSQITCRWNVLPPTLTLRTEEGGVRSLMVPPPLVRPSRPLFASCRTHLKIEG